MGYIALMRGFRSIVGAAKVNDGGLQMSRKRRIVAQEINCRQQLMRIQ